MEASFEEYLDLPTRVGRSTASFVDYITKCRMGPIGRGRTDISLG